MDIPSILARNLRFARLARQLSQKAVAERLGVSEVTVSNHERGATAPDDRLLAKYADLYNVPIPDLRYASDIKRRMIDLEAERIVEKHRPGALPRELRAMALRFLAEANEAGADEGFLRYAKHSLEDPELATLYAGGLDEEGRPMTGEEQREDYEAVIDGLRLIMKRRLQRAGAKG